jgi:hypothetical protein
MLRKYYKTLGTGRILWINDLSDVIDMRSGTWNVPRVHREGSASKELSNLSYI